MGRAVDGAAPTAGVAWRCAWDCDDQGPKRTKEHLFADSLLRRTPNYRQWIDFTRNATRPTPATKNDTCDTCNSGPLGALDAYAVGLYDRYFGDGIRRPFSITFAYDYDLLRRWVLKLCYFRMVPISLGVQYRFD